MAFSHSFSGLRQIVRYYQAGILNTVFGYSLYAGMVALGTNMYVAQIVAHILGVVFNYYTYSRYAFKDHDRSPIRFVLSYIVNYAIALLTLWLFSHLTKSPYLAGLLSVFVTSLRNYVILKRFVFSGLTA